MKKKIYLLLTIVLLSINCYSQFSKTHYIPPLSGASNVPVEEQYLYISCPSITPINFVIKQLGGTNINGTVSRDNPYVFNVGIGSSNNLHVDQSEVNTILTDKGYIIEAEDVIYVTARVIAGDGNQAGEVVSKGLAALGTQFRIGGFTNMMIPSININNYTFISILATENNTEVSFSDIELGAVLVNDAGSGSTPGNVFLNAGESYVLAVQGPNSVNRDALIGALVSSDKPIAVNCGSYGGTNGEMQNQDLGFDQIVSAERTGTEYIFIKNDGLDNVERVLLIAHEDNTDIFLNGNTGTPDYTLQASQYILLNGTQYGPNGNLYVNTSKNIFAYQSVGDGPTSIQANQELFFVPPLSCQTPKVIDNIPLIEEIGTRIFTGRVTITTETGSALNFVLNGTSYTLATLPATISVVGPTSVLGNANYECYTITGFTGNVSVYSTGQLYLAAYGSNGNATFGGYYSGFTFKPEITFQPIDLTQNNCIPNVSLEVSTLNGFDFFQWYFNDSPIAGANSSTYSPTLPGYYHVSATITSCGIPELISDKIPVSDCPTDMDNDNVNDNIDQDLDNDGIANCTESLGNSAVNLSNTSFGSVTVGSYSNLFSGTITTTGDTPTATPFVGNTDGSFVASVPKGEENSVTYQMDFVQPISLLLDYPSTASAGDLLNSNLSFVLSVPVNKTITVLNPSNQLLIDTNYDGIYESDVTSFSSFEIRFRYDGALPLAAGAGTFKFYTHEVTSLKFKQINLVDRGSDRKATFKLTATCVSKDSDNDGIPDKFDLDSENDSISDFIEAQGSTLLSLSNTDANGDGIDDVFGTGLTPANNDTDTTPNYLDLDSDNDGIFDIIESGSPGNATNTNGDTVGPNFGTNGLDNTLETSADSGVLNYSVLDTDTDGILNYIDSDSDNDNCNDIIEAGYSDANGDGIVGDENPATFNTGTTLVGTVISSTGYGIPNANYITSAPIIINTQPQDAVACELQSTTFTINTNPVNSYQWQLSTDSGTTWTNIIDNVTYSGSTTITLTVSNVTPAMVGYKYRVFLNKNGNTCGLYSAAATLTTYALPVITSPVTLVQCDNDTDGVSTFNLTEKNTFISANSAVETFTYFTTFAGADNNTSSLQITTPFAYTTTNSSVYVRVVNANGCYRVAQLNLVVSATQLPSTFIRNFYTCDDYIDATNDDYDGISLFDFSSVTTDIQAILPTTASYTINYYRNEADALSETNAIPSSLTSNYRNIGYPGVQNIWVRVDSDVDNACFGLGPYVVLTVEALPVANSVNATNIIRTCDDNHDGIFNFDTSNLEATILNGQTNVTVTYFDELGNPIIPLPNPLVVNTTKTITARVTNNSTQASNGPCFDEVTIQYIVDDLPEAFVISNTLTTVCDDEIDPIDQNGLYDFDTSTFETTILNGQTGMVVKYFDSSGNPLPSPLPNPFTTGTQNVTVLVENTINTSCSATIVIPFIVNPTPKISLTDNELVCTNLPTFLVTVNAGILDGTPSSSYNYQWYLDGTLIPGATSYNLDVNTGGIYTVDVTNSFGCTKTRTIDVYASDIATIQDINIIDLSDVNTVEVIVTGTGDYVYSIDDSMFQESNFFTNIPMGIHTIFIKDLLGCGTVIKEISVLGVPQYFTPNGDGYNDTWNIKGANSEFYSNSIIYIFDRFGKLIKQISPIGPGWDGTYNGNLAPSDDYWYNITFDDGRSAKGHFSLKR
ncbi:T9SS type B sorting domain-containing protein [Flavobacterium sp.]|uniref:T9SS type B sorting domain-containing protein n=1 Tax=Flavobacterium sp. TaxID=239 RepID=UPI00262189A1|nr:T9SS type B sorting domain-containing protein [Flavobacterium sp.]